MKKAIILTLIVFSFAQFSFAQESRFSAGKMVAGAQAGISWVAFGAKSGSSDEETSSSIAFGGGVGTRYYFTDKFAAFGEGKYRFASFKTDNYTLTLAWYSIYVGVSYAIN